MLVLNSISTRIISGVLFVVCFTGCRPPIQWGQFVVSGQRVLVDEGGESIKYAVLGNRSTETEQTPLLIVNLFPTFNGPYGFSHEGTHSGSNSADRLDISGGGSETSVLIQWDRAERDEGGQTVVINGKSFSFAIGEPLSISLALNGDVKLLPDE